MCIAEKKPILFSIIGPRLSRVYFRISNRMGKVIICSNWKTTMKKLDHYKKKYLYLDHTITLNNI